MHLPPARAEKWISKRGTLRFIQENDTGRARTPHFLPSVCYGRQVVSSRVQGGARQNALLKGKFGAL